MPTKAEREHLRDAAKRMRDLASSDAEKRKVLKFKRLNALQPDEPAIYATLPWDAGRVLFIPGGLKTEDPFFREIESRLVYETNQSLMMDADMPVIDVVYSGLVYSVSKWMEGHVKPLPKDMHSASAFEPCVLEYGDLAKMQKPRLTVDWPETLRRHETLGDAIGDILEVRKGYPFGMTCGWGEGIIDQWAELRGLEQMYYDISDAPEFFHAAMRRMTDAKLDLLRQYRESGALCLNNGREQIGSHNIPFTDELPGKDFNPANVEYKNLWGFAHAQEFTGVSVGMFEEFLLRYQAELLEPFGLVSYGCCEPMDRQIEVIARYVKNLRIISISPYSDVEYAASVCRGKYLMAIKLHPSLISHYDESAVKSKVREIMEATRGCLITIKFTELMDYGDDPAVFIRAMKAIREAVSESA
ncbi:MAG: hypothetical protein FWF03_01415 [Defluviitaleaceae bacterium]|nr:hypothetical protein [Defluviitaleaceae bacterium]